MVGKLRELWPVKRVASLAIGFWNAFLRDNKVIPPVLAVAALFVFAWIVFGSFIGAPEDEPVSSQDEIAQSDGDGGGQPPAPEVENPNTDSYAAYQSKDPFRQLFQTPESTTQQEDTTEDTDMSDDTPEDTPDPDGGGSGGGGGGGGSGGSQDTGDDASTGNPGAANDQYDNGDDGGQSPRQDPTEDAGNDSDTDNGSDSDAGAQPPAQPNRSAADPGDPGDGLFDSGGDLREPNRR